MTRPTLSKLADSYWLWIESCRDCTDIAVFGTGLARFYTANLPTDGQTIYITLFTLYNNELYWQITRLLRATGRVREPR